ncbi:hypothetical protein JCM6882_008924 [Rhodosporidiobolus microsporus]
MPSSTLSLVSALLAFSAPLIPLVAAAPNPAWYLAPTTSSSSSSAPAPASTTSLVWYKADPTTTVASSSPVASPAKPASTSPVYTGTLAYNGWPRLPYGYNPYPTFTKSELTPWTYAGQSLCPNSTLPADFKALPAAEREKLGIALNEDFYSSHGSLRKFCGKQVEITDPKNSTRPPLTFTVTRGCPTGFCEGEGVSITVSEAHAVANQWEHTPEERAAFSNGKMVINLRFV